MNQGQFLKATHINPKVVKAVIRNLGGWKQFKETALDVTNYGISSGYGNFVYYADTVKFFLRYREEITALAKEDAANIGESGLLEFIQNFNCLGKDYTLEEIGQTLYASKKAAAEHTQICNGLAWFAAEEVCRSYQNIGQI